MLDLTAKFSKDYLDPTTYYTIKNLSDNDISKPFESVDSKGKQVFKIIKIKNKTKEHVASIKTDYKKIQDMALNNKKQKFIDKWTEKKINTTYIHIDDSYKNCKFNNKWIK